MGSSPSLLVETVDNVLLFDIISKETVTSIRSVPPGLRREAAITGYLGFDWSEKNARIHERSWRGNLINELGAQR